MTFKTSLDGLAKGVTFSVSLLFLAVIIILQLSFFDKPGGEITAIGVSLLLIVIYAGTYFFRPLHYDLTGNELVIHRPINKIIIPRQDIESAEMIHKDKLRGTIRIFGVGGLFGYYGKFANASIGSMDWYATRRDKTVLLNVKRNRKILLTPDEPEVFVQQFSR